MTQAQTIDIQLPSGKIWPQLYALASTGKIKTWQIWVEEDNDKAIIYTKHGYIDGKLQTAPKVISIGKNIGKANETTPFEQACNEAQSTFNKKLDKKYITEIPNEDNEPDFYLPMLAHPFDKYKHKLTYPVLLQPKLNGVRCLARKISNDTIEFTSRKGKSYNVTLQHLVPELLDMMKLEEIFDGEIYVHGWTFQQIVRRVKKMRFDTDTLQYWVYDIADATRPTAHRNDRYTNAIMGCEIRKNVFATITTAAANEKEIYEQHQNFVQKGYEGTIIRNIHANYTFDHRSHDLLKLKDFMDKEFKIIGGEAEVIDEVVADGSIVSKNAVVFTCETNDKKPFNVRPKGTISQRVDWYNDLDNIIGKDLTVRFFEYSEDGIPVFPVGIIVRDFE